MKEISVLQYNNVGNYPPEVDNAVSTQAFARQMQYLSTNGYQVVNLDDTLNHLTGTKRLSNRAIAITIDGGYENAIVNIVPILKQYSFTATFFIAPEFIGGTQTVNGTSIRCLTWQEVRELIESGFTVGLLANAGLGIYEPYDEKELIQRFAGELDILRANINTEIRYCAYTYGLLCSHGAPRSYGSLPSELWAFLQSRGIRAGFNQCPICQPPSPAGISRITIDEDDHNIFLTKISMLYLFFKDSLRLWRYIRRYKLAFMFHNVSEFLMKIRKQ
ncbi:MAG: hypothetical protein A2512_06720 [Deltaproteobacteria bacterium RIFOXYD12_FULL_56_24]|nr:MAG: hypothetical protein A2512_06720 [Deltaproteobacteria bacterium RIFOXYD12_FULL_56_24]